MYETSGLNAPDDVGLIFAASTPVIAGGAALGSLLLYEHAFVQAGQSVPLA